MAEKKLPNEPVLDNAEERAEAGAPADSSLDAIVGSMPFEAGEVKIPADETPQDHGDGTEGPANYFSELEQAVQDAQKLEEKKAAKKPAAKKPAAKKAPAKKPAAAKAADTDVLVAVPESEVAGATEAKEDAPQQAAVAKPATKKPAAKKAPAKKPAAKKAPAKKTEAAKPANEAAEGEKAEKETAAAKAAAIVQPDGEIAVAGKKAPAKKPATKRTPAKKAEKPAATAKADEPKPAAIVADERETAGAPDAKQTDKPAVAAKPVREGPSPVMEWLKRMWKPFFWPVTALVAICLVASLLLAVTNYVTEPIIERNTAAAANETRRSLLPAADGFAEVALGEMPEGITSMYEATNGAGYVIEAYATGYGGKVPVMVAFNGDGTIVGVQFLENDETPGLGQKVITDKGFSAQFVGRGNERIGTGDVDKIASATVSTNAAVLAVNSAIELFNEQVLGIVEGEMSEEQILASLLPGAGEIAEIQLAAEGIERAFAGDDGGIILFSIAPGFYGKDVTAAVGFDAEGVITGLWLDTSSQTAGYGQEIASNAEFIDQFIGQSSADGADIVAGSTGTSDGLLLAIRNAISAFGAAKEAV